METFIWPVKFERRENVTFSSIKVQFNEGYKQRVGFGINNKNSEWDLSLVLLKEEAQKVMDFFDRHGDYKAFLWKHPDTGEMIPVYLDDGYQQEFIANNVKRLSSIRFVKAYGVRDAK